MELSALEMPGTQPPVEGVSPVRPGLRAFNLMWISYALLSAAALYLAVTPSEAPLAGDQGAVQLNVQEVLGSEAHTSKALAVAVRVAGRS